MRIALLAVAVTAVSAVTVTSVARGETDREKARRAFHKGRDYFKAGEYAKALEQLKLAYETKPHPVLLRFMGQTYYKMNKARLAIDHFKRYLEQAPKAPDRAKVEARIQELEMVLGADSSEEESASDEEQDGAVPAPPPPAAVPQAVAGEDSEVPDALGGHKTAAPAQPVKRDDGEGVSFVGVAKWVALGLGVGGLALGVTFNVLASNAASDIEQAVINDCPQGKRPPCNPKMNDPQVAYSRKHHDLLQKNSQYNALTIASYVAGGVLAAGGIALFVVDAIGGDHKGGERRQRAQRSRNVALAPIIGKNTYGVAGLLRF